MSKDVEEPFSSKIGNTIYHENVEQQEQHEQLTTIPTSSATTSEENHHNDDNDKTIVNNKDFNFEQWDEYLNRKMNESNIYYTTANSLVINNETLNIILKQLIEWTLNDEYFIYFIKNDKEMKMLLNSIQQLLQAKTTQDTLFYINLISIICFIYLIENGKGLNQAILLEYNKLIDIQFILNLLNKIQTLQPKLYLPIYLQFLNLLLNNSNENQILNLKNCQYIFQFILKDCQNILIHSENINFINYILDILDLQSKLAIQQSSKENLIINNFIIAMQSCFKDLIDILVGWFLDRNTNFKYKLRIGETLEKIPSILWEGKHFDFTLNILQRFLNDMINLDSDDERQVHTFLLCSKFIISSLNSNTFLQICLKSKIFILNLFNSLFLPSITKFQDKRKFIWKGIVDLILKMLEKIIAYKETSNNNSTVDPYQIIESDICEYSIEYLSTVLVSNLELSMDWFDVINKVIKDTYKISSLSLGKNNIMENNNSIKKLIEIIFLFIHELNNNEPLIYLSFGNLFHQTIFNIVMNNNINEILKLLNQTTNDGINITTSTTTTRTTTSTINNNQEEYINWSKKPDIIIFLYGMIMYSIDNGNIELFNELIQKHDLWTKNLIFSDPETFLEVIKKLKENYLNFLKKKNNDVTIIENRKLISFILKMINQYLSSKELHYEFLDWLLLIFSCKENLIIPNEKVLETIKNILDSDAWIENKLVAVKFVIENLSKINTDKFNIDGVNHLVNCFYKCLESNDELIYKEAINGINRCGHVLVDEYISSEFKWFKYYHSSSISSIENTDLSILTHHFEKLFNYFKKQVFDPEIHKSVSYAVMYCIVNRLKTPFGNAMQTFEEFEKLLQTYPSNELLQYFIGELQRQVNSIIISPNTSLFNPQVVTFFTNNQKVCMDWFNRLLPQMSGIVLTNGFKALLIQKENLKKVENLLITICTVVCDEYCDNDILNGLLQFVDNEHPNQSNFVHLVNGFYNECLGRFEEAIKEYKNIKVFIDEQNETLIQDRIFLCNYYLHYNQLDQLEILKISSTNEEQEQQSNKYSKPLQVFIEQLSKFDSQVNNNERSSTATVDLFQNDFHLNRYTSLLHNKSLVINQMPNDFYIRKYAHQNIVPFVSHLIPTHKLNSSRTLAKNGILIYVDQKQEPDEKLFNFYLASNNLNTANNIIDNLSFIKPVEKEFLRLKEKFVIDVDNSLLDMAELVVNKINSNDDGSTALQQVVTTTQNELTERVLITMHQYIDEKSNELSQETLNKLYQKLTNKYNQENSEQEVTIKQLLDVVVTKCQESSQSSKGYELLLDHIEKYGYISSTNDNNTRLDIYRKILQYQADYTKIEIVELVAKLLDDLKYFKEEEFEQFVKDMDDRIWISFIPQIVSLYGEFYSHVKHLFRKLGKHRLHSIIYPSVVKYLEHAKNSTELISELRKINPDMVNSVLTFVTECKRMTHIWHDIWLQTLTECKRYLTKTGIKSQKFKLLLEQTYNVTMNTMPETKQEHLFQINYQSVLQTLYLSIIELNTSTNNEVTNEQIGILKKHINDLIHQLSKSSIFREFQIEDVVPKLLNSEILKHIPIPGSHLYGNSTEDSLITIENISNKVKVLGSKTKPKKIIMKGNNGKTFTFLLKGKEDARLDQRMQQFISITNMVFKYNNKPYLRARHYDVTPLGKNSGLIEWIDNTQTIYSLYRKNNVSYKPMDHYYKCLLPLLKTENVTKQPYPTSILKKVYAKCRATIDKEEGINNVDTLQRHILFNPKQTSMNSSFELLRNFVMSTACMSMIGYVIGLGDRHLDNILLDQYTSEVIHIDYQICFNQGSNLPVPELVPFRLTPCINLAMGDVMMKTKFTNICEQTLSALHQEKNMLIKLLMTFVNDPLIDQTSDQQLYSIFDKQLDSLFLEQVVEKKQLILNEFNNMIEGTNTLQKLRKYCLIIENKKIKEEELNNYSIENFNRLDSINTEIEIERKNILLNRNSLCESLEFELKKFSDESLIHFNLFNTFKSKEFNLANTFNNINIKKPEPLLPHILPYLSFDSKDYNEKVKHLEEKQNSCKTIYLELVMCMREIQSVYRKYTDMEYISQDIKYIISNTIHQLLICNDSTKFIEIIKSIKEVDKEKLQFTIQLDNELDQLSKSLNYLENKTYYQPSINNDNNNVQEINIPEILNQLLNDLIINSTSTINNVRSNNNNENIYNLSDWCGFKNLLKLEACITYCHDYFDNNRKPQSMLNITTPTKEQLLLLYTSLNNMKNVIKHFLENLIFVLIPECIKLLSQSELFNQIITTLISLFENNEMSIKEKMIEYQSLINNNTSLNVLCLAFETQFNNFELPFKELSLIPNVNEFLFITKMESLKDIFIELLNYDISYNNSNYNILNIMKDHMDTLFEKITIPTLIEMFKQWNIYNLNNNNNNYNLFNDNIYLKIYYDKLFIDFEEFCNNNILHRMILPRHKECYLQLQYNIWNNRYTKFIKLKNKEILEWKIEKLNSFENILQRFENSINEFKLLFNELKNLEIQKYLNICKPYLNDSQYNGLLLNTNQRNLNYENIFLQFENEILFIKNVLNIELNDRLLSINNLNNNNKIIDSDLELIYGKECFNRLLEWMDLYKNEIKLNEEYKLINEQKDKYEILLIQLEELNEELKDPSLVKIQTNHMYYTDLIRSKFISPYKQVASKYVGSYLNMISQLISVLQSMIELSSFHKTFKQLLLTFETKLTNHYELINQYFIDCNDSLENKKDSIDSLFHYIHHQKLMNRTLELHQSVINMFDFVNNQLNDISKQIEEQTYIENDEIQLKNRANNNYDGNFILNLVNNRLSEANTTENIKHVVHREMEQAVSEENLSKMYKGWIPWL
ncbi:hypothetical protein ABK040_016207 [Willaertia magna]